MTWDRPIRTRPLPPDDVLEGLRDIFVRGTALPRERAVEFVHPDAELLDLISIDGLDPTSVELYFGTGPLSEEWWETVVDFGTVAGLCRALAEFVEVPVIDPVPVLGRPCPAAGAFLLVRRILADAGADVSRLRPSSPLMPYVWLWPDVFRWHLPRVAPGRVPEVRFLNHRLTRRILGVVLGVGGLLFGLWLARAFPWLGGLMVAVFLKVIVFDLLLTPVAARRRNWSVQFGGLYDFRDLAAVLADSPAPRPRPHPQPAAA
jgi:hypothetical protein